MIMQDALKQLIKDEIAPLFKAKGFKKKGNNFAKMFSDFAWTVNIQSSKWNTKEEVEFTFNTGIFTDKIFGPYYQTEPPKFPTEIHSVLRFHISELKNEPHTWYRIDLSSDLDEVKREVRSDIQKVIFPYFEKFQTINEVMQEMKREDEQDLYGSNHFLTILYKAYGYNKEAQERINKAYAESEFDSQKEYAKELANYLGLLIE
ncbi:DUF4304 domain-containing protein [Niallia sp. NCCP-28]|uniref:DUF4304 domain-containing protein n=1 Tax=Niallia sp. NCCP-28 TaxID=2934712 RepID=UPI002081591A|nr:DUF4304 domain-containing protein [Niallia sp. NCCP-28]GKU84156.1 hypothetical protein NCCP28_35520 [Niallia sp. NCCP-28]